MPKIYKHPFECKDCEKHSKKDFIFYEKTGDYLMLYPEENMIHLHAGIAPVDEDEHIEKAKSLVDNYLKWFKEYPDKDFLILLDFTRTTNTSYAPPESFPIYLKAIGKKQYKKIIFYGTIFEISFFAKSYFSLKRKDFKIVKNYQEAETEINKWKKGLNKK